MEEYLNNLLKELLSYGESTISKDLGSLMLSQIIENSTLNIIKEMRKLFVQMGISIDLQGVLFNYSLRPRDEGAYTFYLTDSKKIKDNVSAPKFSEISLEDLLRKYPEEKKLLRLTTGDILYTGMYEYVVIQEKDKLILKRFVDENMPESAAFQAVRMSPLGIDYYKDTGTKFLFVKNSQTKSSETIDYYSSLLSLIVNKPNDREIFLFPKTYKTEGDEVNLNVIVFMRNTFF